eukprot:631722-Amphidinium_carterae.1
MSDLPVVHDIPDAVVYNLLPRDLNCNHFKICYNNWVLMQGKSDITTATIVTYDLPFVCKNGGRSYSTDCQAVMNDLPAFGH